MTDRLLELAREWGVPTTYPSTAPTDTGIPKSIQRPRNYIALDLLAKLPKEATLRWNGYHKHWAAEHSDGFSLVKITCHADLPAAMIALAERARKV